MTLLFLASSMTGIDKWVSWLSIIKRTFLSADGFTKVIKCLIYLKNKISLDQPLELAPPIVPGGSP